MCDKTKRKVAEKKIKFIREKSLSVLTCMWIESEREE